MENWYLPITIVPGLGLLILSTSNLMVTLSHEISAMLDAAKEKTIIARKLKQLKLLNMAMVFFYVAVALLLISAVCNGLYAIDKVSLYISVLAIVFALMGLFALVTFSFRAVSIRQSQFNNNLE
jgi:predicted ferric reductase